MAYTFQAATTAGNASGGAITISRPAGTVDGALIAVIGYLEDDANTWASVGAGFTALRTDVNAGTFGLTIWWKRASGEPTSWTWTPTNTGWRTLVALTWTGNTGSGNQVDVDGAAEIADADITAQAPSIVTTVANDLLVAVHGNYQGANGTETGAATNERAEFGGVIVSDALSVAAGATGTTTFSVGTVDHVSRHLAFLLDSGGGAVAISPTSIAATTTVGQPALTAGALAVGPTAIATTTTVGSPALVAGAVTLSPTAIAAVTTVGSPTLAISTAISPTAIGSSTVVGSPTLTAGAVAVTPVAVASAATVGSPTLTSTTALAPAAIGSSTTVGTSTVSAGAVAVSPTAIGSGTTVGVPALSAVGAIQPATISAGTSVGSPTLTPGAVALGPAAIASGTTIGTPSLGADAVPELRLLDGYTDVNGTQVVRTAGNRVYIVAMECDVYPYEAGDVMFVYRADQTGLPTSFSQLATGISDASTVAIAIDGADDIHVLYHHRPTGDLRYRVWDTATDAWLAAAETIATGLEINNGQGDSLCSLALDATGVPHVVYLISDGTRRRPAYRNRSAGTWSAATFIDGGVVWGNNEKAWQPNLVFDGAGRILAAWHRGTFNATAGGTCFTAVRSTGGSWASAVSVGTSWTEIDNGTSMLVTSDGRYHLTFVDGAANGDEQIRYYYSDDQGATWTANHPGGGTAETHNPSLGPGSTDSRIRIWGHGPMAGGDHGENVTYFEGPGGAGDWGSRQTWVTFANYDSSVNTRWSQYFHHEPTYADLAYWDDRYPNILVYGGFRVTIAARAVSPTTIPSDTAVGTPSLIAGAVTVTPSAIPSGTTVGSPALTPGAVALTPAAIAAGATVGTPALAAAGTLVVAPIAAATSVGQPALTAGAVAITPLVIPSATSVSPPALASLVIIAPVAIGSTATVGMPSVGLGAVVLHPVTIAAGTLVGSPALSGGASAPDVPSPTRASLGSQGRARVVLVHGGRSRATEVR